MNATITFPLHANGQFGIRAATVGIATGITSGDNDIAVEVAKVSAVAEPVAAIIAPCDRVDMIAAELLDADAGFGIEAGIGCSECIHSISPSRNVVRSWHKNAAVWKSK